VSFGREPIRSYQRIFRPERRIYHLEGHPLPVPGGVPLRWLAYASAALLGVLALCSGSATVAIAIALGASAAGFALGGPPGAALAGSVSLGATWLSGFALGLLDWPLRLIVVPVAIATLATQATPDGRRADRFAASWLALRLAPRRRSLGRAVPVAGLARRGEGELWVAPDEHSPRLRRARISGVAAVEFARPISVRRGRLGARRLIAGEEAGRSRRGAITTARLAIGSGEALEVRR
jgi:hypothetical protein